MRVWMSLFCYLYVGRALAVWVPLRLRVIGSALLISLCVFSAANLPPLSGKSGLGLGLTPKRHPERAFVGWL